MKYGSLEIKFKEKFKNDREVNIYAAPGRIELGGNHTDHQGGPVLVAAINLESRVAVARNGENTIRAFCEGHGEFEISLSELEVKEGEKNSTPAIIRGIAKALSLRGASLCGVDMYVESEVLPGSGLSSSAAFEVVIGKALSDIFGVSLSPEELAEVGQFAEREFFGKPCGLMDQMASSVGGITAIDFSQSPAKVEKIECDISEYGYDIVIVNAGADHADLTEEYADIPREMCAVAEFFGKRLLCEVLEEDFYNDIASVRKALGDRAVLRAIHYFNDSRRAREEAVCLKNHDFEGFLKHIKESGDSSYKYLQNIYPAGEKKNQAMAFALAICERLLGESGAVRIQGGGFGGTLEAFVPNHITKKFTREIERILGKNMCMLLSVSNSGGVKIK